MRAGSVNSSRKSRAYETTHGVSVQHLEAACEMMLDSIDCSAEAVGAPCPADRDESVSSIAAESIRHATSSM